uniref:Uncharacterized protein n=1 Tax=Siphoviridae sp. ctTDf8 TaxID=2825517 RepID=A0A8S5UJ51_9CAUD|nr:MAG TPA: Protein of unknown function (DUF2802) [Siphoviridae sp. ctTDf8]
MELKDLLGADYKEGMTAEEIAAALTTKSFVSKDDGTQGFTRC